MHPVWRSGEVLIVTTDFGPVMSKDHIESVYVKDKMFTLATDLRQQFSGWRDRVQY